jgi:hypothetical protein
MTTFRYEISPVAGGWVVACNGVAGPPYTTRERAVLDTLAITKLLRADGHRADLRVLEIDGSGRLIEARDSFLFASR